MELYILYIPLQLLLQMYGTVYCRYPPVTPANVWNCGSNGNPVLEPGFPALNVRTVLKESIYDCLERE